MRVGVSVSGYQTHGERDIIHLGLFTKKAVPATTQNCATGCVTDPMMSLRPFQNEEVMPLCLPAKHIPGVAPTNGFPEMGYKYLRSLLPWAGSFGGMLYIMTACFLMGFQSLTVKKGITTYLLLVASLPWITFPLPNQLTGTEILFQCRVLEGSQLRKGGHQRPGMGVQLDTAQALLSRHEVGGSLWGALPAPCSSLLCMAMERGWGPQTRTCLPMERSEEDHPS